MNTDQSAAQLQPGAAVLSARAAIGIMASTYTLYR
jgi:hypothetical protein